MMIASVGGSIGMVLYQWYQYNTLWYACASLVILVVAGVVLGVIADLMGRLLGVNTNRLEHERNKVK